jgi:peptide deformylase
MAARPIIFPHVDSESRADGHPVLRQRARPISLADLRDPMMQTLINDMIDTMYEYSGVGLAAPQIHEDLRLFVALLDDDPDGDSNEIVVVNPEIVPVSDSKAEGWEGCLSIPDIRGRCRATPTSSCARSTGPARRSSWS